MSRGSNNKRRIFLLAVTILTLASIALFVPVYGGQSLAKRIFQHKETIQSKHIIGDTGGENLDFVWTELEKIQNANRFERGTLTGNLTLSDNFDESGVREKSPFVVQAEGENRRLRVGSFERVKIAGIVLLIDNEQEEITQVADSVSSLNRFGTNQLSIDSVRALLSRDGTTASLSHENGVNILRIEPGTTDAVNRYILHYDAVTYSLRKLQVAYTSVPYESMNENDSQKVGQGPHRDTADQDAIDLNLTEYVLEYEIDQWDNTTHFDFINNELYRLSNGKFHFKGKLATYAYHIY